MKQLAGEWRIAKEVMVMEERETAQHYNQPLLSVFITSRQLLLLYSSALLTMKLFLAVSGIISSQTLLPVVSWAKVLTNKKLDTDDPRSSEEPPVFRGGSHLMHVGSMCYNAH